jgi:hypothetical protein
VGAADSIKLLHLQWQRFDQGAGIELSAIRVLPGESAANIQEGLETLESNIRQVAVQASEAATDDIQQFGKKHVEVPLSPARCLP